MKLNVLIILLFVSFAIRAQEEKKSSFTFSGYLETYFVGDFNNPKNGLRPKFVYSYNRSNEVAVNLAYVKAAYVKNNVRANLALMTGSYANAALAAEPGVLKNIFEANAGVKLSSKKNLWIDAGVFSSHIGFESAVGKDSWNLTRSMLADNSPYFESGARLSYTSDNEKWYLAAMIINGWNRIQRLSGNTIPSSGTQVTYKPSAKVTLNSSTFIGTDTPDSTRRMRYFSNLYGIFQLTPAFGITVGFDSGLQQKGRNTSGMYSWYSPVIILRSQVSTRVAFACRGEYYSDKNGVIIETTTPNGFQTTGVSVNVDYKIADNALWRIEARSLNSRDAIFTHDQKLVKANNFITTSLAVSF